MNFEIGIEKRKFVLTVSLLIEKLMSFFLSALLGIQDHRNTTSFGNKSSSLSFGQKLGLLIDIEALAPEDKNKFLTFMEIRNQFMHNLDADTYEKCFGFLNGKDTFILKQYPQDKKLSKEEQLEKATEKLASDILDMSAEISKKLKEKLAKEVRLERLEETQDVILRTLAEFSKK